MMRDKPERHTNVADRCGLIVAVGFEEQEDLHTWMVRQGHTVAYRRYAKGCIVAEEHAQIEKRGKWSGQFTAPWMWRLGERLK
ncbi:MAG: hypothetical protein HEP70_08235 [Rhodobiaceae bacterium]|nr:hypothetical protein [Rhodobiaceae bacterium]